MRSENFGSQLRLFRQQTLTPKKHKPLTQQQLGELLGIELADGGFSGAAVSDWERNNSKINADQRLVLLSLIKVLKQYGGIKSSIDANALLEAGNYRSLNQQEKSDIFPEEPSEQPSADTPQASNFLFFLESVHLISPAELQQMFIAEKQGPSPAYPRFLVSLINKSFSQITSIHVFKAVLWVWICFFAYLLIVPSLNWSPAAGTNPLQAVGLYAIGSLILPMFVGAMTNTDNNIFWKEQDLPNPAILRLYIHQGAFVGFHVGYFFVFLFSFLSSILDIQPSGFINLVKTTFPIAIAYVSAQLVPYNLWLAYKRLDLRDGGIFFFFAILGPIWGVFFLEFYKTLTSGFMGTITLLIAITIVVWLQTRKDPIK